MIGNKIRALREAKGWTQEQLAERMGYTSKSTINKIEKNINDVNQKTMLKFANVFGCDVTEFVVSNNAVTEPGEALIAFPPHYDLSDADRELLDSYHSASPEDRAIVDLALKRNRQNP